MRRRTESVDFGPISLKIADQGASTIEWDAPSGEASVIDAMKLKRLMGGNGFGESIADNFPVAREEMVGEVAANTGRPPQFGNEVTRIIKLAASVAYSSSSIATSVSLRLTQDLLPNSELSVEKHASGFHFDLRVGDSSLLSDLERIAEDLVHEIGQHLDVSIRLRLFSASEASPHMSTSWCRGQY